MARKPNTLRPTRQPGQYSLDLPNYLMRWVPQWSTPEWALASAWRKFVQAQPVAIVCRETMIANLIALDHVIVPRESEQRDELKSEIQHYTRLLDDFYGLDYVEHVEWLCKDLLDLPFGAAAEVGREGDRPEGRVVWVKNIDAGTLFPTQNLDFPVGQRVQEDPVNVVYFPRHAIDRVFLSPRPELTRAGWGMAPPEKIFLAMELLSRGDQYYANLLLDTPEAGILDLGDMTRESAESWIASFQQLMSGIDAFKIPVLYEHTTKTSFIPFTRPPTDLMYDRITLKYASIVAAGYGMTLGDIGMTESANGGETMAGTIRQERRTRKTGFALLKKKIKSYFDKILPEELEWKWIDYDDELNVNLGRARLANATAMQSLIQNKIITPEEGRLQVIADGLITIPIPEKIPESALAAQIAPAGGAAGNRTNIAADTVPASQGGYGMVSNKAQYVNLADREKMLFRVQEVLQKVNERAQGPRLERLIHTAAHALAPAVAGVAKSLLEAEELGAWQEWHDGVVFGTQEDVPEVVLRAVEDVDAALERDFESDPWYSLGLREEEFFGILAGAYLYAIQKAALEMTRQLYVEGLLPSPDIAQAFDLRDAGVLRSLREQAAQILQTLDEGTKYYLKRIVISNVRSALLAKADLMREGVDINTLLSDNNFVRQLIADIQKDLYELAPVRSNVITSYEIGRVEEAATAMAYAKAGLTEKQWNCYGSNPCEICRDNEAHGMVALSFVYRSTFGGCREPKAHPNCECGLTYNPEELVRVARAGTFLPWTGY